MVQKSKDLYAMANEDSDTQLVLNVTSAELNTRMEDYDKEITGAAFYGKTVVVNVSDSGTVNITGWMNAHGAKSKHWNISCGQTELFGTLAMQQKLM